ncbi:hypothetical protein [Flavobacterium pedocola]
MKKKLKMLIILFGIGIILSLFIKNKIDSDNDFNSGYSILVENLDTLENKRVKVNGALVSPNFIISVATKLKIGDSIVKPKKSRYLYIYTPIESKYVKVDSIKATGLFN